MDSFVLFSDLLIECLVLSSDFFSVNYLFNRIISFEFFFSLMNYFIDFYHLSEYFVIYSLERH